MLRIAIFNPLVVNHVPPLRLYAIQVLGHAKTVLIISFGFVVQNVIPSTKNAFGLLIAFIGMMLYSYYVRFTLESFSFSFVSSTLCPWRRCLWGCRRHVDNRDQASSSSKSKSSRSSEQPMERSDCTLPLHRATMANEKSIAIAMAL